MTKTPEELADEYAQTWWGPRHDYSSIATRQAFIAGYQAAQHEMRKQLHHQQSSIGAFNHVAPICNQDEAQHPHVAPYPHTFIPGGTNVEWIPGYGWRQKV